MTYSIGTLPLFDRKMKKIAKKNRQLYESAANKLEEIVQNPHHYKPLGNVMAGKRRVHLIEPFVMVFSINEEKKMVVLEDIDHHDKIYC